MIKESMFNSFMFAQLSYLGYIVTLNISVACSSRLANNAGCTAQPLTLKVVNLSSLLPPDMRHIVEVVS